MSTNRSACTDASTGAIVALATRLVQEAPVLDRDVIAQLVTHLRAEGSPLAQSLARVVELLGAEVDPAIALPALAMACGTLADRRLTEREREAARFEIETLLPVPGKAPKLAAPDVPVDALRRR